MSSFDDYADRYQHVSMRREDGVLEVALHSAGDSLVWGDAVHRELPNVWLDIGADPENKVIILTGTGQSFCEHIETSPKSGASQEPIAEHWYRVYWEAKRIISNLLDIEVPMIGVINGPARVHAELPLLCDMTLAASHAVFQDAPHFPAGLVPGDGVQVLWPLLLGMNRGRYFLLTGQELSAQEALALGVVNEVHPASQLLERAWELAHVMASRPALTLRYTRIALSHTLRRLMADEWEHGALAEVLSITAKAMNR